MRTDARRDQVPPGLLRQLDVHLQSIGSELTPAEAASEAIVAWMSANLRAQEVLPAPGRGYQWKTLFLPDTTRLRMSSGDTSHHATVVGDRILFRGRAVSPRGMTLAIAGEGRNAWRDLWLKLPGERYWKNANRCRCDLKRDQAVPAPDPAETVRAAALAMCEALKHAQAMVDQMRLAPGRAIERRAHGSRRGKECLGDDCAF